MLRALVVDGAVVSPEAAAFTPLERGLLYGDGLFESIAVHGNAPLDPICHHDRMAASASALGLPVPPRDVWDRAIAACLAAAAARPLETVDALRVTWTRGAAGERGYAPSVSDGPPRLVVAAFGSSEHQRTQWESGVSAAVIHGLNPGDLARHKTLSAMTYVVASARARAAGAAEALLVDEADRVLETAGSNVFLVRAGAVVTPPAARPILAGIGRTRVLEWLGERAAEGDFTSHDLGKADEAFLTNAVRGVVPLVELDERAIGGGRPGPVTIELQARWQAWAEAQATSPVERAASSAVWITRREIRVNRTATCWLVRRFLAPDAQFEFVEPDQVAGRTASLGGTAFDAPGARYPHRDANGRCSFAALVHERLAHDPVLIEMARIVQAADFKDQNDDHPAARGLIAISQGFPLVARDDHETVARAQFVYDSMYAGIAEGLRR
jgi:branched-subunit amino acid aminotransferase/4-amino-4-deoxychorismate lyase